MGRNLFEKSSCCYYDKYWNILVDYNIDIICDHFLCRGSLSFSICAQRRINSLRGIAFQFKLSLESVEPLVRGPYAAASVHCTSPHKSSPLFVMRSWQGKLWKYLEMWSYHWCLIVWRFLILWNNLREASSVASFWSSRFSSADVAPKLLDRVRISVWVFILDFYKSCENCNLGNQSILSSVIRTLIVK